MRRRGDGGEGSRGGDVRRWRGGPLGGQKKSKTNVFSLSFRSFLKNAQNEHPDQHIIFHIFFRLRSIFLDFQVIFIYVEVNFLGFSGDVLLC